MESNIPVIVPRADRNTRKALIKEIREHHNKNLASFYVEAENLIDPQCSNCEAFHKNKGEKEARCSFQNVTLHAETGLCAWWGASFDAFCKADAKMRKQKPYVIE